MTQSPYDNTNQLTGETRDWEIDDTYAYDANGNRTQFVNGATTVNYTIGDNNQLASGGGWTYTYDNEGNLTVKADSNDRYTYTYDHRNRLTRVEYEVKPASTWVEEWQVDNYYDAFDRLVRRKDDVQQTEWPNFAGSDTVFSYEDGQVVLAFEVNGTTTQRFLWGPNTDQLLATEYSAGYYGAGHIYFPLADAQGTIHDAAKYWYDSQAQTYQTTVVMHRWIDAYGRDLGLQTFAGATYGTGSSTHSYAGPLFVFTGRYLDPLTELQNNHHRWYAPELGRWMSEDPMGFAAGDSNLNRYVGNNPTNGVDPSGLLEPGTLEVRDGQIWMWNGEEWVPLNGPNSPPNSFPLPPWSNPFPIPPWVPPVTPPTLPPREGFPSYDWLPPPPDNVRPLTPPSFPTMPPPWTHPPHGHDGFDFLFGAIELFEWPQNYAKSQFGATIGEIIDCDYYRKAPTRNQWKDTNERELENWRKLYQHWWDSIPAN